MTAVMDFIRKRCIICEGKTKIVLNSKYINKEDCFQMLEYCFNLNFPKKSHGGYHRMCVECILRLRECFAFRVQCERAHWRLEYSLWNDNHNSNLSYLLNSGNTHLLKDNDSSLNGINLKLDNDRWMTKECIKSVTTDKKTKKALKKLAKRDIVIKKVCKVAIRDEIDVLDTQNHFDSTKFIEEGYIYSKVYGNDIGQKYAVDSENCLDDKSQKYSEVNESDNVSQKTSADLEDCINDKDQGLEANESSKIKKKTEDLDDYTDDKGQKYSKVNEDDMGQKISKHVLRGYEYEIVDFIDNDSDESSKCSTDTQDIKVATGHYKIKQLVKNTTPYKTVTPPKLVADTLECPICFEKFATPRMTRRHYVFHNAAFLCEICGNPFLHRSALMQHIIVHDQSFKSIKYKCNQCIREYVTLSRLRYHQSEAHSSNKLAPRRKRYQRCNIPSSERKFACVVCHKRFEKASSLRSHMIFHTEYFCEICPRFFVHRYSYLRHMEDHGDNFTVPDCEICGKSLKTLKSLDRHRKQHLEEPVICHSCGMELKNAACLERHLKTNRCHVLRGNRPVEDVSTICKLCGRLLKNLRSLKKHLRLHKAKEKNPVKISENIVCNICKGVYKNKLTYEQHLRIYHEETSLKNSENSPPNEYQDVIDTVGEVEIDYEVYKPDV